MFIKLSNLLVNNEKGNVNTFNTIVYKQAWFLNNGTCWQCMHLLKRRYKKNLIETMTRIRMEMKAALAEAYIKDMRIDLKKN